MAHELLHLSRRVFNTPQLIAPASMEMIASYLKSRNIGTMSLGIMPEEPSLPDSEDDDEDISYSAYYDVGVIDIKGVLTNVPFEGICGEEGCSYESIQEDFQTLIDVGAKTIVLCVDSGGGEAYGAFEAALYCQAIAKAAGTKIVTYVDGCAFSAAYVWASIADELIVNPLGEVGSIGVVVQLVNTNRYDQEQGIDKTYLYAGDNKIPFDKNGNFRDDFLESIQEKVDIFYSYFVDFVATTRNIKPQAVIDTKADTYLPEQALALGLIDKVMTKNDFISYIFKR